MQTGDCEIPVSGIDLDLTAAVLLSAAGASRDGAADCDFDPGSRGTYLAVTGEGIDDHPTPVCEVAGLRVAAIIEVDARVGIFIREHEPDPRQGPPSRRIKRLLERSPILRVRGRRQPASPRVDRQFVWLLLSL